MSVDETDDAYERFARHTKSIAESTRLTPQDTGDANFLHVDFKDSDIITIADVVEAAARKNPDFCTQKDEHGAIPLHSAALAGDLKAVIFFINVLPESMLYETNERVLPLHLAVFGGHQRVCEELLRRDPSTASAATQHGLRAQDIARHFNKTDILESISAIAPEYYVEATADAGEPAEGEERTHVQDDTQATATPPTKQEVHIPTTTAFPAHARDLFDDSVVDNTLTTTLDVSQLLLDEFHSASLLEDEQEAEINIPVLSAVQYEKHTRMTPYHGTADGMQGSEMFNLSDELLAGQPHRGGLTQSNRPRNTIPPPTLSLLGVKAVRSPFLFDKPSLRQILSRPSTGKAPGSVAQRPTTSGASGLRPGTSSARGNNNHHQEATRAAVVTAPQLHTTVQVVQEVSVPALIITTAAVQRPSPSAKNRKHRPLKRPTQNNPMSIELTQEPSAAVPAVSQETEQVYALHKPLSAQPATARSPTTRTANTAHRQHRTTKEQEKPTPPQSPTTTSGHTQPPTGEVQLTPETRKIEGKHSPAQSPLSPPQESQEVPAAVEAKEKVLAARSHVHKVTIAHEFPAGSLPGLPQSPSGFAPSRALRPSKILCAAMLTPAERQKLDLAQMAHEAQKICQDPDFVPTLRPVHNAGTVVHKNVRDAGAETTQATPTRAQRYEMLRDYSHRDPTTHQPRGTPVVQHTEVHAIPRAQKFAESRPAEPSS